MQKRALAILLSLLLVVFLGSCLPAGEQAGQEQARPEPTLPAEGDAAPAGDGQGVPQSPAQGQDALQEAPSGMVFEVAIPENTPAGDTVWIYVMQIPHKMEKIKDFTHTITLNETQLFNQGYIPIGGDTIRYRYSRNRYDFHTAEYLVPTPEEPDRDTNNYFWTAHGRDSDYEPGKIQKDTIERWRWFPKEGTITKTTHLEPSGNFLPRVNNLEFRSGQTIEDLYVPAFHDFFDSIAHHVKEQGYTWVEIDPPWQWTEVDNLPKVANDWENNPNYPDDGTFLEEVQAYKKQGLKVLIAPQLCCSPLDTANRTEGWWRTYFNETERFLLHFASLAEQADADAFSYAVGTWETEEAAIDIEREWRRIFGSIRNVFSGEVGQMVWVLGPDASPSPVPIPQPESVPWAGMLDFILVASDFPLSMKDDPTNEELKKGADAVLDGMKVFYDTYKKPILIRNGYFNVRNSWKGQSFYSISSIPWIGDPEAVLKESKYEFDTHDHARVVHAYFRAIAERPWAIGYFHFGYTHWENPLSPWMSIRGKPAEDIWRKWNGVIYEKEELSFEEQVWRRRIEAAMAPVPCPDVPKPDYPASYYQGPLIDTHLHIPALPDWSPEEDSLPTDQGPEGRFGGPQALLGWNVKMGGIACTLKREGTRKNFAFFPVYQEMPEQLLEVADRTLQQHPALFTPFIMSSGNDNEPGGFPTVDAAALRSMLAVHPGLFRGYGEIGLYAREGGSDELPPDSPRLQEIYPILRQQKLAAYFHLGEGHKGSFKEVLRQYPAISFIWHGDQLSVEEVEEILDAHPNAYYGIDAFWGGDRDLFLMFVGKSKEAYLQALDERFDRVLRRAVRDWKDAIERHPDQFLWGIDRGDAVWNYDRDVGQMQVNLARAFIGQLDPAVQEKFAYKNAERVVTAAGNG